MHEGIRPGGIQTFCRGVPLSIVVSLFLMAVPGRVLAQLCGTPGNAPCVGTLLTGYYDTSSPPAQNGSGAGDNTVELINPQGCANSNLVGCNSRAGNRCAMIYVFDKFENMGECCGCLISPEGLLSLSVQNDLTSNWGLLGASPNAGAIDIVSANPNVNGGCNPGRGYFPAPQLNGYVVHDQRIPSNPPDGRTTPGISEIELADAGATDVFLEGNLLTRCGRLEANNGICSCGAAGVPGTSR